VAYADDDGGDDDDDRSTGFRGSDDDYDDDDAPRIISKKPRQPRANKRAQTRPAKRTTPAAVVRPIHAPDEIVVAGVSDSALALLSRRGFTILSRAEGFAAGASIVRLRIPRGIALDAARANVRTEFPQATVDFNHYYQSNSGEDCNSIHCRTIRLVHWPSISDTANACTGRVIIGIVDTDINIRHTALQHSNIELIKLHDGKGGSRAEHGTAVAAILVGSPLSRSPGLVPRARLVAVDAFEGMGRGADRADAFSLSLAISILVARKVGVINLSLTGPPNDVVERAIHQTEAADIVIVAAAGNDGPRSKPAYPAAYDGVIAVTAVDRNLRVYRRASWGAHIDLAAPGVGIWTAASVRGAKSRTGTSFAAPFVTAAAALIRERAPDLDRFAVHEILIATARDLGEPGHDPVFGAGLLQVAQICNSELMSRPSFSR